ncbi:hypothetical protein [Psychrilyobacter atlanticus]|uniref:hypothetical protein n=1 Tax=Psychrilyobacter atlanticus TaxID=271091 RepID=UPI0004060468|nr:hypothetical protein [Psychrilyobacter atlanticus]
MNWKKQRELRQTQMKALEDKRKDLAKKGWKSMGKIERDQLYKKINFDWDNMHKFIRDKIPSKEKYLTLEIENYCVKKAKKLNREGAPSKIERSPHMKEYN